MRSIINKEDTRCLCRFILPCVALYYYSLRVLPPVRASIRSLAVFVILCWVFFPSACVSYLYQLYDDRTVYTLRQLCTRDCGSVYACFRNVGISKRVYICLVVWRLTTRLVWYYPGQHNTRIILNCLLHSSISGLRCRSTSLKWLFSLTYSLIHSLTVT